MTMSNGEKMLWAVTFHGEIHQAQIEGRIGTDTIEDFVQRAVEEATGMVQLMRDALPAVASVFEQDSEEIQMLREMLGRGEPARSDP